MTNTVWNFLRTKANLVIKQLFSYSDPTQEASNNAHFHKPRSACHYGSSAHVSPAPKHNAQRAGQTPPRTNRVSSRTQGLAHRYSSRDQDVSPTDPSRSLESHPNMDHDNPTNSKPLHTAPLRPTHPSQPVIQGHLTHSPSHQHIQSLSTTPGTSSSARATS